MILPGRPYWIAQLAGWEGYLLILWLPGLAYAPEPSFAALLESLPGKAVSAAGGFLTSLGLFAAYRRLLPERPRTGRLVVAVTNSGTLAANGTCEGTGTRLANVRERVVARRRLPRHPDARGERLRPRREAPLRDTRRLRRFLQRVRAPRVRSERPRLPDEAGPVGSARRRRQEAPRRLPRRGASSGSTARRS